MKKMRVAMVVFTLLCTEGIAQANVFNLGPGLTNLETVTVGDQGNTADTRYASPGYGSVNYTYSIGKYEVTTAQYCDFLNQKAKSDPYGLYYYQMRIVRGGSEGNYTYTVASGCANLPIMQLSYWHACRFVNWLNNGQGNGDTETGAYTLNAGYPIYGPGPQRNAGAKWFLPNEDEWYKAAYYKAGSRNAGYWDYPTRSNSTPSNDLTNPDGGNNANFDQNGYTIGSPYYRTSVGEFENSASAYGTFDQGGNVWEYMELGPSSQFCRLRGGSSFTSEATMRPSGTATSNLANAADSYGFRIAYMSTGWQPVPEPSSLLALSAGGLALLLGVRRRRR